MIVLTPAAVATNDPTVILPLRGPCPSARRGLRCGLRGPHPRHVAGDEAWYDRRNDGLRRQSLQVACLRCGALPGAECVAPPRVLRDRVVFRLAPQPHAARVRTFLGVDSDENPAEWAGLVGW